MNFNIIYFAFLLVILNTTTIFSQEITSDVLDIHSYGNINRPKGTVGFTAGAIYYTSYKGFTKNNDNWSILIQSSNIIEFFDFNNDGELLDTNIIRLKYTGTPPMLGIFQFFQKIGSKTYGFWSYKAEKHVYKLLAIEVDLEHHIFLSENPIEILTTEKNIDKVKCEFSADSSRVLFYFDQTPHGYVVELNQAVSYALIDTSFHIIDEGVQVKLPYQAQYITNIIFRIVDDKVELLLGINSLGKKSMRFFSINKGILKETEFNISGLAALNVITATVTQDRLLFSGFYKDFSGTDIWNGYYTAYLDKDYQVKSIKKYPFTADFSLYDEEGVVMARIKNQADKGNVGLLNFAPVKIIDGQNGELFLVGELVASNTQADIFVACISSNGKEKWISKVKKHQLYTYWSGVSAFEYNHNIYLFYYNDIENKDRGIGEVVESTNSLALTYFECTIIDENGKAENNFIYANKDVNFIINPNVIKEVKPGTYYCFDYKTIVVLQAK